MDGGSYILCVVAAGLAMSLVMSAAWLIQKRTAKTSWIDVCWTLGTGLTGVFLSIFQDGLREIPSGRQVLVAAIAALWSGRLGWYLISRARLKGDDPRYRAMIAAWGKYGQARLFWHLQIQAFVGLLLASCTGVAARNPVPLVRLQDLAAIALILVSVTGEALADDQMRRFRRSAGHGQNICDVGLWRWSRHPNYFFEWLFWVAFPLLAVSSGYAVGWVAILAPLCMYWLLVHVSGIPPLEAHLARSRAVEFAEYCRRTSAFFPFPPRRAG
jgi:steroid 5-alpha reductase family enzyme